MSLQDLLLDDNEISIISSDIPTTKLNLKRLSLADNPLNCDCTLLDFVNWLHNSSLEEEDKASAVCATPPALENGILTQVSPGSLLCGEPTPPMMTKIPLAGAQLTLKSFEFIKKSGINLLWNVEPCTERYTCDTLIVYEAIGDSEVEIESSSLHCDSRLMRDPCALPVTIPASMNLQNGHKYRYCVVLLVPSELEDISLGLGCSDVIILEEKRSDTIDKYESHSLEPRARNNSIIEPPGRILGVQVNVSEQGFLNVNVKLSSGSLEANLNCELAIVVFCADFPINKKKLNCSLGFFTMAGLVPGNYRICASLDAIDDGFGEFEKSTETGRGKCVEVQVFRQNFELIILAVAGVSCAAFVIIFLLVRGGIKKLKCERREIVGFGPAQEFEITHKAHYIKLLATTKV